MKPREFESGERQIIREAAGYIKELVSLSSNYIQRSQPGYLLTEAICRAVETHAKLSWQLGHFPQDDKGQYLECLDVVAGMKNQLRATESCFVRRAREEGASWADVAKVLGITRQAAQQKFGK